jgi:hypothetical protein
MTNKSDISGVDAGSDRTDVDPFTNLDRLRLRQDFETSGAAKKLLTTVPVRKPGRQDFVRVHPDAGHVGDFALVELKDDGEVFLVVPELQGELLGEWAPVRLFTAVNRQGVVFLWPVRLPDPETGRGNSWHESALDAAERAKTSWIRLASNRSLGAYEIFEAAANLGDPTWPEAPFPELLKIGFRDRIVDREDHPLIARLRGLA